MKGCIMPEKWLRCNVFKGMFSDERVVKVGGGQSFFVHRDKIIEEGENHKGKVRVRLFETDNAFWAVMPTEDAAVIQVKDEELENIGV
jgi:hypothetical protein